MVQLSLQGTDSKISILSVDSRPRLATMQTMPSSAQRDIRNNDRLGKIAMALQKDQVTLYQERGWGTVTWSFYGQILMTLAASPDLLASARGGEGAGGASVRATLAGLAAGVGAAHLQGGQGARGDRARHARAFTEPWWWRRGSARTRLRQLWGTSR
jgi:hypothetical protein